MKQQFLTVYGGSETKSYMIKTYSFTTDDDEEVGSIENDQTISNHDKLLSISSPSIDSYTNDDNGSEANTQLTRRKSRKKTEVENHIENKRPSIKKRPWYRKIDLSIPLMIAGICIFIYFMWIKRDVWIPRLLTSNSRIRRSAIGKNEQTIEESTDSPLYSATTSTISSKNSAIDFSDKENIIKNVQETKNDENNNEGINLDYNEDSSPSSKSTTTGKMNIRVRRNKMSFNKDRQKKKGNPLQPSSFNDDDNDEEKEEDEEKDKPIERKNPSLPPSTHLTKKEQHRSMVHNKYSKGLSPRNSTLHFSTYNDILEQLRKNLKSLSRHRGFLSTLSKRTGLNKSKLYRFIYKKDYQLITIQTFLSLLDSFNLTILIVPK